MKTLRRLRATPVWALLLGVGLLAGGINLALVTLNPPAPRVHDEFSYLLAADTFAEGRVTNPTHPHWPHFETMHVIQRPSYASKYPPGQGLLLAAGRIVFGSELAGVCLSTGLAAAACVWMLLAWAPSRWALLGGLIVATHAGIQLQWGMGYWGGSLAMAAGALIVGGGARLARGKDELFTSALMFAIGAVTLAITRPFEGFLLVLGAAVIVAAAWLRAEGLDWRRVLVRALAPIVVVGCAGLAGLLAYNHGVTGSATTMPYQIHEHDYGATPLFVWQTPDGAHDYRHDPLRRYHLAASMWWWSQQQTLAGFASLKAWLTRCSLEFFFTLPVALAMLAFGWVRRRELRPWLALGVGVWAAACGAVWMFPHYLAPLAPLMVVAMVFGLRSLHTVERRLPTGRRWIAPSLVMLHVMLFVFAAFNRSQEPRDSWAYSRQAIEQRLRETPGDDLVFVRYSRDHNVHNEWVYNRADIDAADVVWAREMSPIEDRSLRSYFGDRAVWVVLADEETPRLLRYGANMGVARTD